MGITVLVAALITFIPAAPVQYETKTDKWQAWNKSYAQTGEIRIIISPTEIALAPLSNQQFSAFAMEGKKMLDPGPEITWQAQGGTINSIGTFTAPAVDGQYTVTAAAAGASSATATVTVSAGIVPPYKLTSPNKGETFMVGDTVTITWEANLNEVSDAGLSATLDGGATLENIYGHSISPEHDIWGAYPWLVPEKLGETPLAGKQIIIRVHEYYGGKFDNSDLPVNIVAANAVRGPSAQKTLLRFAGQNRIIVNSRQPYRAIITDLSGRELYKYRDNSPHILFLKHTGLRAGFYLFRLETGNRVITNPFPYYTGE